MGLNLEIKGICWMCFVTQDVRGFTQLLYTTNSQMISTEYRHKIGLKYKNCSLKLLLSLLHLLNLHSFLLLTMIVLADISKCL
jgi:hypothetical protein